MLLLCSIQRSGIFEEEGKTWNNALQDQTVEEEAEYPTELLVQLGNEWS